jgi:PAS domain S-box-containing protein
MGSVPIVDYRSVFETAPGLFLILAPDFTIVAVSNAYLEATLTTRNDILSRGLFDVFPDNPDDKDATGVSNLRASLNHVLKYGEPHKMAVQKYDIRRPDGSFEERYWSPLNTPVLNEQKEIVYIIHNVVDVTSDQQTAERLKKSENDYQLLVNSVKDYAIFMVDIDGKVASWNSGAQSIKGYIANEIIGQPIDIFYTPEDIKNEVPQHNLQMALQYGHFETEGWRVRKYATLFWANIVITALKDEQGQLYGYSKITRDITERKKEQDQVASLSLQINQSNDAIYTVDAAFKIKTWNRGAQKLYGFTEEEVLGKDSNALLNTTMSADEITRVVMEIAEKDYWSGELKRKTKDDRDIYVLSSNTPIRDKDGVITGYTAVSFDITEQKRLREQVNHLANIVEHSSEAIISRGFDRRMLSWNKGAEVLFGYTKEEAIGKTAKELGMVQMEEQEMQAITQEVIQKGSWKSEMAFFHKDGSPFYGAVTSNAVRNEQGEVNAMVFIIKDISLSKQLELQLKKSNEELEEIVEARTAEIIKTETRFRTLIENSNDIISLLDESLCFFYRSPSATRITGWTNEEMLNTPGTDNIHPDDKEKASDITKACLANPGKAINCLIRSQHKNGHYLWMEGTVINLLQLEYVKAVVFNFRDVTERIQAEEKLIASERRFRSLIENNNDIIVLTDADFQIIYRSPSATRITGWTDDEMESLALIKKIHPADKDKMAAFFETCMANPGKQVPAYYRTYNKEGDCLHMEGIMINLLHEEHVNAIVLNLRDVTERIQAAEKIAAGERQFRTTLDNMLEGVQILNFDWQYVYVNDALVDSSKYTREELLGYTMMEKYPGVEQTALFKTLKQCMLKRKSRQLENEFVYPDGTKASFELSVQPVPQGIFILSIDITARKLAEQELKKSFQEKQALAERMSIILNTLPANIALLDSNGCIIDVNESWRNFATQNGYTGINYYIGENYLAIANSAMGEEDQMDGKKAARGIKAVLSNKLKQFEYEYPCHSPTQQRWFRMIVTPLQEKKYAGAVVMHIDISELRRLEQERLESKMEEQQKIAKAILLGQEKERNHIGQELHDNVNQILASTKMYLGVAGDKNKETKKLIKYPMELIDISMGEIRTLCHQMVAPLKNIDLEDLIRELLHKLNQNTQIKTELVYAVPDGSLSDDLKLNMYRIIQELFNNILKYARAKNVMVAVVANNGDMELTVTDDGVGFDPEKKRKGIGVSNIINRAKSFNGEITIHTAPGKGCSTFIHIPY